MKKNIDYEVCYDLSVEITYLGEENPGEHYFSLHRHFPELTFDDEEDEAKAVVFPDGKIEIESYEGGYLRLYLYLPIREHYCLCFILLIIKG